MISLFLLHAYLWILSERQLDITVFFLTISVFSIPGSVLANSLTTIYLLWGGLCRNCYWWHLCQIRVPSSHYWEVICSEKINRYCMRLKTQTLSVVDFAAWIKKCSYKVFNFPDCNAYDVSITMLYNINWLNPPNKLLDFLITPHRRKLRHRKSNLTNLRSYRWCVWA